MPRQKVDPLTIEPPTLVQFSEHLAWGKCYLDAARLTGLNLNQKESAALAQRDDVRGYTAIAIMERMGGSIGAINAVAAARMWELHNEASAKGAVADALKALEAWSRRQALNLSESVTDVPPINKTSLRDLWEELRRRSRASGDLGNEAVALKALDGIDGISVEAAAQANLRAVAGLAGRQGVILNLVIAPPVDYNQLPALEHETTLP